MEKKKVHPQISGKVRTGEPGNDEGHDEDDDKRGEATRITTAITTRRDLHGRVGYDFRTNAAVEGRSTHLRGGEP